MRDFRATPEPGVSTDAEPRYAAMADESRSSRWKIISYFAILNLSVGMGAPLIGLAAIPIKLPPDGPAW